MLVLWLGSCSNAHAMCPRGAGVWEEQAQLPKESLLRASLALWPRIFLRGFSGAPDKSLPCESARPGGQRWLQLRLVADVGRARCPRYPCLTSHGPQRWLVHNPCTSHGPWKWAWRGQGGQQRCTVPTFPRVAFQFWEEEDIPQLLGSSWRMVARPSFASTLLFNSQ